MICKPEDVVMILPAVWADTPVGAAARRTPAVPTATAKAIERVRSGPTLSAFSYKG
jgi:hypothetical protein